MARKLTELRGALALAQTAAQRLGVDYLGTEHILMGIAGLPSTLGARMLMRLGVVLEDLVRETERAARESATVPKPTDEIDPSRLILTPGARQAVEIAGSEADRAGRDELSSDYVVLGLLLEGRGIAAKTLARAGVTVEALRMDFETHRGAFPDPASLASVRARRLRRRRAKSARPGNESSIRMTEELRKLLGQVRDEAQGLRHAQLEAHHFLLAVAHTPACSAATVLQRLGVELADLAHEVMRVAPPSSLGTDAPVDPAYSEEMLHGIRAGRDEWKVSGRELMDSTHLLVGVLIDADGLAAKVLQRRGVTAERVRTEAARDAGEMRSAFRMEIDDTSALSIYEQVIARVEEAIATGSLKPGDRLPAVRQLADSLDIAPGTVARAYAELESRGVVTTDGARGTRVAEQKRVTLSEDARRATLIELLRPVAVDAFHLGASTAELHAALDAAAQDIFPERGAA